MREIISPNVKYIEPLKLQISDDVYKVRLHEQGIIEIETYDYDIFDAYSKKHSEETIRAFDNLFERYDRAGHVYPVSVTGLQDPDIVHAGSKRFCTWSEIFAQRLTNIINLTTAVEVVKTESGTKWYFDSVSKYFRFMRYTAGGEHFPHYDSDFVGGGYNTKYSLVMYFNDCESGELAFVDNTICKERVDWGRQAKHSEIYLKIKPRAGKIVIFPHALCHTVLPYTEDGFRRMVRGDLIFTL